MYNIVDADNDDGLRLMALIVASCEVVAISSSVCYSKVPTTQQQHTTDGASLFFIVH